MQSNKEPAQPKKKKAHTYRMIQQLHSWEFILEELKLMFSEKPVHKQSWHAYLVIVHN